MEVIDKSQPAAESQKIWEEFFKKRDENTRNLLVCHYLPIVKYTAERLHSRFPKSVELDDINSVGVFGLVDAINKFDPKRNVMFETYCVRRIEGAIWDDLRKRDWIPRLARKRAQQLQKATRKLEAIFGRLPSDEELADELKMDMTQFYSFRREANPALVISLNTHRSASDGDEELGNLVSDKKSQNPFLEIHKKDIKDYITKGFSREEKLITVLYYYEELTMREIGEVLGISESRVCQIHSSLISRLKALVSQHYDCLINI
jgi:RNA polymerase sigma factor FliA